jgi:hypothetical protein
MSNPQQETKIELVTEAIESLTRAVVAHQADPLNSRACYDNVRDARAEVASSLRELLTPTLRVFTNPTPPTPLSIDGRTASANLA